MLIEEQVGHRQWTPLKVSKNVHLSHVFYADDVFLFGGASVANMEVIMNTISRFSILSGLKVNMNKSCIIFPNKMSHTIRSTIASTYGLRITTCFGKYLGVDIRPNKLKISNYFGLLDKTMDRIKGWQAKLLNMAGRCTLIKSVLNTYPLYNMQTNMLPISIITTLEKACRRFLWNKVDRSKYLARTSWDKVTSPMSAGGLGIRRLRDWNLTFMAKLGWKIMTNPNKLWVQI